MRLDKRHQYERYVSVDQHQHRGIADTYATEVRSLSFECFSTMRLCKICMIKQLPQIVVSELEIFCWRKTKKRRMKSVSVRALIVDMEEKAMIAYTHIVMISFVIYILF